MSARTSPDIGASAKPVAGMDGLRMVDPVIVPRPPARTAPPRGASRPPWPLVTGRVAVYHPCTETVVQAGPRPRRRDGPENAPRSRGVQGTLTRRATNGTGHVTLASRDRSAHVPGRKPALGGGLVGLDLSRAHLVSAQTPKRGGTLTAAAEIDPIGLDPHNSSNFSSAQAYDHIYESLTSYDEKTNIVPCLATSWEVTNGGKTYTFKLRPNVKFHNGQTMSADDVKYSIERVLDPKTASPWISWLKSIKEIKVVDPLTVQMNLDAPYPLLGSFAGIRASGIIPKGSRSRRTSRSRNRHRAVQARRVRAPGPDRLRAEPDYWDKSLPYLDGMVFKVLTEENARIAALKAGQIQYAFLSGQGAAQLEGAPGITVAKSPTAWVVVHYINKLNKPLSDARVRRALRMAVDTNEVIQKAAFGAAVPSGPVPTGYGDWYIDPKTLPFVKADVEGAKKLLAEAGYPNGGFKIEIKCSPQYPEFVATTLVIQESLKKLNVDVTVTQMEWARSWPTTRSRTTAAARKARTSTRPPTRSAPTRTATLPLLPLEGGDQQGRLRHAGREARRPAGRGAPVEQPRGAEAALRGNPASCYAGVPRLVVVREVQHRGDVEQAPGLLPVVHRPPAFPQEGLARLGKPVGVLRGRLPGGGSLSARREATAAALPRGRRPPRGRARCVGKRDVCRVIRTGGRSAPPSRDGTLRVARSGPSSPFSASRSSSSSWSASCPATSSTSSRAPRASSAERSAAVLKEFGLDQPLPVQYLRWVGSMLQGNFGWSFRTGQPVAAPSPRGCRSRSSSPSSRC